MTFQLLKDVENLDIDVFYSGKSETTSVYLQKGVSANIVTVNSAQFSQEADLESQATFDLSLEKFSRRGQRLQARARQPPAPDQLRVLRPGHPGPPLPDQVHRGRHQHEARPSSSICPRTPTPRSSSTSPSSSTPWPSTTTRRPRSRPCWRRSPSSVPGDIDSLKAGYVRLELIPRGVGKIEVQAVNLYHEIKVGQDVEMEVRVKNAGTRKLNNIRVFADLPAELAGGRSGPTSSPRSNRTRKRS